MLTNLEINNNKKNMYHHIFFKQSYNHVIVNDR